MLYNGPAATVLGAGGALVMFVLHSWALLPGWEQAPKRVGMDVQVGRWKVRANISKIYKIYSGFQIDRQCVRYILSGAFLSMFFLGGYAFTVCYFRQQKTGGWIEANVRFLTFHQNLDPNHNLV